MQVPGPGLPRPHGQLVFVTPGVTECPCVRTALLPSPDGTFWGGGGVGRSAATVKNKGSDIKSYLLKADP